jgi:peptide/nickel transport system substrate-binding protein
MRITHYGKSIVFLCVLMTVMVGCSAGVDDAPVTRRKISYGLTLSPSGFDPHINQSSEMGIVLRQVYDTLLYRDPETGVFVSGLAESWEISEDQTVYTFKLREDVTFHDGTRFDAAAVAANLNRITASETRSQNAVLLLGPYVGYTILDDFTIEIRLSEPYAPLLDSLSQFYLGMASPTAFNTYGLERYQFNQVGTGPYIFVEYVPDDHLILRRNAQYRWGPSFYRAPAEGETIEEIEFRFFRDPATRLAALEQGVVEIIGELPPADARILIGNNAFQIVTSAIAGQPDQIFINTRLRPTDSLNFRQALLWGTNRTAIIDALYLGFSTVASGPLASKTQFFAANTTNTYAFDVQQARAVLSTLGYVDADSNGFWDTSEGDLSLVMLVPPWGEYRQIAQLLQDQWKAIGIRLNLVSVSDFSSLMSEIAKGEYHLVPFGSYGVDPAFLSSYYVSNAPRNFSGYSNPNLDALLLDGARQLVPSIRADYYRQAQGVINEQALIIPLRERVNLNGVSTKVRNLRYDIYGWYPLLYNAAYVP